MTDKQWEKMRLEDPIRYDELKEQRVQEEWEWQRRQADAQRQMQDAEWQRLEEERIERMNSYSTSSDTSSYTPSYSSSYDDSDNTFVEILGIVAVIALAAFGYSLAQGTGAVVGFLIGCGLYKFLKGIIKIVIVIALAWLGYEIGEGVGVFIGLIIGCMLITRK